MTASITTNLQPDMTLLEKVFLQNPIGFMNIVWLCLTKDIQNRKGGGHHSHTYICIYDICI